MMVNSGMPLALAFPLSGFHSPQLPPLPPPCPLPRTAPQDAPSACKPWAQAPVKKVTSRARSMHQPISSLQSRSFEDGRKELRDVGRPAPRAAVQRSNSESPGILPSLESLLCSIVEARGTPGVHAAERRHLESIFLTSHQVISPGATFQDPTANMGGF